LFRFTKAKQNGGGALAKLRYAPFFKIFQVP